MIGVPPEVVVALVAAATEGLRTTMGVPPRVGAFVLAAAAMAAALSSGGGGANRNIVALYGESWV
jgi:hypothetical protein